MFRHRYLPLFDGRYAMLSAPDPYDAYTLLKAEQTGFLQKALPSFSVQIGNVVECKNQDNTKIATTDANLVFGDTQQPRREQLNFSYRGF